MGFGAWLRRIFSAKQSSQEMVPFLDVEVGRVIRIPVSELRPGCIQVSLVGSDEIVWALPEQLHKSEIKHPEFDESIRDFIRKIQTAFAEHRAISFEEWEEGFQRDSNPAQQIALWLHASNVYMAFANGENSVDRRRELYRCILASMTTGPTEVWKVFRPEVLTRAEAEMVVNRLFGKQV